MLTVLVSQFITYIILGSSEMEPAPQFLLYALNIYGAILVCTIFTFAAFAERILPAELCRITMNDDTKIATFLPSVGGAGQCSVALMHYLIKNLLDFFNDVEILTKVK